MMKQAIIIHGWGADSTSNWFPWLRNALSREGWSVTVPDFPNTQNPILEDWITHYKGVVQNLTSQTRESIKDRRLVLIGHSLGVPFILRYLEKSQGSKKVDTAYLVSGFERKLGIPEIDNFVSGPFDWEKIRSHCRKFFVINSDNDPYIPLSVGKSLAEKLKTGLIVVHGGGHLNAPGGYLEYSELLDLILSQ